jgi:Entner-Doudoroff aldolase
MSAASSVRRLEAALAELPVIAILRGLRSEEAVDVVEALYAAGVRVAEVPLNSPDPFVTIRLLVAHFGERMVLGGGTVVTVEQADQLAACGAQLCVSPNTDPAVIARALARGMAPAPGFFTPTEAFAAYAAGARHLKMFPSAGRAGELAALKSVLPRDAQVVAVGGVNAGNAGELAAAGASSFGIGGELYKPGMSGAAVGARARELLPFLRNARGTRPPRLLCNPRAMLGESPLWDKATQRLVWTDPLTRRLLRAAPDGACEEVMAGVAVWSLAGLPDGGVVGTTTKGFCRVAASGAVLTGPPAPLPEGMRFNDMTVDAHGGLWAGAMHTGLLAGTGALYHAAHPEDVPRLVARGLGVPNGMGFSPDGATLYLVDTLARTLLAYPVDPYGGGLREPAVLSDFLDIPGKPDGMTVGPDGSLWVAMWGGARVLRLAPDGAPIQSVKVPAPHVSSLCFDDAGTLYVTTSRMRMGPRQLVDAPGAGGVFAIEGIGMD